ncbi:PepSY domain-containing protein [Filomicrobium sp.]|uniref:PepSY domain-containing protein n=1 Tax=Filomicrobium sp. TaxID=2024831 RepID=UPI00258D9F85|nr:PepSY domain-containing protein [Filomicrobium sp.]MCV0369773.1 PepSY domain-containing protein [Filomicrobium sp.]
MPHPLKILLTLLVCGPALLTGVGTAVADDIGHEEARRLVESGRILPLAEIVDKVSVEVPGDILETELEYDDGIIVYDFKILRPDGRVQEVEVHASTGDILKIEDDD